MVRGWCIGIFMCALAACVVSFPDHVTLLNTYGVGGFGGNPCVGDGPTCVSNEDCGSGFYCDVGLCSPMGTGNDCANTDMYGDCCFDDIGALCESDADCCSRLACDKSTSSCAVTCDPLTSDGCSGNAKCSVFVEATDDAFAVCISAGPGAQGDSCKESSDCGPMLGCCVDPGGTGKCCQFCDGQGAPCTGSLVCHAVSEDWSVGMCGSCTSRDSPCIQDLDCCSGVCNYPTCE